jgi:membrane-bound lytic murein transglycosylase D
MVMNLRICWTLGVLAAAGATAAEPPPKEPPPKEASPDELYQAGKDLFDSLAPPEVKAQFEFPDKAQWDAFAARLQTALESNDLAGLAQYEPEARAALTALRTVPGSEEYIDWLEERLDYIEAAKQTTQRPPPTPPPFRADRPAQFIPHYDLWVQRLQARPKPAGADQLIPLLGAVFAAAGLPAGLAWLAEVESSLNPAASSPAGARGLFQLMPATAKELGLSTFLPDERTDPKKSAGAAAQLLRTLHKKFGDWPLAFAAYNAGAGRVQRTLDQQKARTFAEIASALPAETRLYVPKVLAMLQVRAGMTLAGLAPPRI